MSVPPPPYYREAVDYYRIQQRYATARTAIKTVGWMIAAYFAYKAVDALSGQTTSVAVSLILNALVDLKFVLSIALTGAACAWAVIERALRHRKVDRMQERLKELETRLDPGRSSSGLTTRGETHPRDRG
jgi:hypothetical protein